MPTKAPDAQKRDRDRGRRRSPLTRERVLREALALVDEQGLEALTMRALGARLGVEAMSLYSHVQGKDGLRDGIRELLWEELGRALLPSDGWRESMCSLARSIWSLARAHPQAFPLIVTGATLAEPMLRALNAGLHTLEQAGFDRDLGGGTLTAVVHYALGYSMMGLACMAALPGGLEDESELDTIVRLTRALPADAPAELVRAAKDCCARDFNEQFEFGLEALLAGLDPNCDTHAANETGSATSRRSAG